MTLLPGEPAVAYYPSGDGAEAQAVLAIGAKDASDSNKAKVFFYDQKEIKSIIDALDANNISYTSGATDVIVNESETVDAAVKALDAAVAKIQNGDKTYKLVSVSASGETVKEEYELHVKTATGEWAKAEGSANIKIYKDSSIVSIEYVTVDGYGKAGQFLKYTYINAEGEEQTTYVDLSNVVIEAEFKNGLQVTSGEVSVKIDSESDGHENFLSVSDKGVKISGVQDAINASVYGAVQTLDADFTADKAVASIDGHVTVGLKEEDGIITSLSVATDDIASAALLGTTADTASDNTAFGKIAAEAARAAANEDKIEASVGLAVDGSHVTTTGNYTSGATTIAGEIAALDTQVKANTDAIAALDAAKVSVSASSEEESTKYLSVSANAEDTVYTVKVSGIDNAITSAIEGLDKEETTASAAEAHVTIKYSETDGIVTINATENDIASAALLGTTGDTKDNTTAFGFIAKEAANRAAAINNLNVSDNTSDAVAGVTVTVNETAGLVQKPVVSVANNTVTYTAAIGDTAANLVVADEAAVIKGEAIAKIKSYIDAKTGAGIDALDAVVSATTDYVNYSVTETDGKLTAATLNVTVQAVAGASASAKGLAEAYDVKTYVDNAIEALDKEDTAVDHQFVTAVSEENGVITVSRAQATAADIAATAISAADDTVAIAGTDVKTQIENIGKAIKATDVKNELSSTSNALSVNVEASGTTITFNISADAVTQDMLSVANDGLKIADTWDCGEF